LVLDYNILCSLWNFIL